MINNVSMSSMAQMMQPKMNASGNMAKQSAEDLISAADGNQDGMVDNAELTNFLQAASETSGNNAFSDEVAENLFADFDADGDGSITQQEASSAVDNLLSSMRQEMQGMMPPPSPQGNGQGPMDPETLFSNADSDGNAGLDLSEFTAMLENGPMGASGNSSEISSLFDEADADTDGVVTFEEMQAAMESHHAERQALVNEKEEDDKSSDIETDINPLISQLLRQYQAENSSVINGLSETA